jgi:acyl carrier protein
MKQKIEEMIIDVLQGNNDDIESEALEHPTEDTKLFGEDGALDSLALVSVITDLEDEIYDKFDKHITLADEKTMSRRSSPFSTVKSLRDYIHALISE